ncbi:MAG: neutral/alkaline non-lysosomal ceramidase N-terminal domain-containing protein [Deltaproteobacteria bacterium]|nr:neutral/alkaline non-lysosomal ceramidase N-terminal domain-containing protein [Deltaproteobacteria bacterium]
MPVDLVTLPAINRRAPRSGTPGRAKVGCAVVDFTPPKAFDLSGYSLAGKRAVGIGSRLRVFCAYLEDPLGRAAAWVSGDLHSGTRYLFERTAALTAAATPIGVGNLLFSGTHTHTGPGQFYGNALYDLVTTPFVLSTHPGFRAEIADNIAGAAARAVALAYDQASSLSGRVQVGYAESICWGYAHNRSAAAFDLNPEAPNWPEALGVPAPPALADPAAAKIDPRVRVLTVSRDGRLVLLHAIVGCHATALGAAYDRYHPDWPGYARDAARDALGAQGVGALVTVVQSGAGDVNALVGNVPGSVALAEQTGRTVGRAIAEAALRAQATARDLQEVEARFSEVGVEEKGPPSAPLAARWAFGLPTLGGSEESPSPFYGEGRTGSEFDQSDPPQSPKKSAAAVFSTIVPALYAKLDPSPVWPLSALRLNQRWFLGVPFEPTGTAALRLQRGLDRRFPNETHTVVGYTGDYHGYLTTPEEYRAQHYEGASTIWGKNSLVHLSTALEALMTAAPPVRYEPVRMRTVVRDEMNEPF